MAQSSAQIADLPRRRVAIVDDDDLFRESLGLNLQEEGYEVVEFANGQDALDHFIDGDGADAVLLDWRMPVLDGLATLRRLREAGIAVPVIFLTMLGDHIYEEAALQWGAIDFIDKSRSLSGRSHPHRVQHRAQAGKPARPGRALSGYLRPGARQGLRLGPWCRRLSRQRAFVHQADPPEVPRRRRWLPADRELSGVRLPLGRPRVRAGDGG
jgi:two-component system response regulator ChvI